MYACVCACACVCVSVHVCVCVCVCVSVAVSVYAYAYAYAFAYAYAYVFVCLYVCIYIYREREEQIKREEIKRERERDREPVESRRHNRRLSVGAYPNRYSQPVNYFVRCVRSACPCRLLGYELGVWGFTTEGLGLVCRSWVSISGLRVLGGLFV